MKKFNREEFKAKIKNHRLYQRTIENKRFLLFLIILITIISYSYFSHGLIYDLANNDLSETLKFINSFGDFSWLVYIFVIIIEVLLAPIPGLIMNSAGGIIFKPFYGALLTLIGNIFGASIAYFLAKYYAGFYFERFVGERNLEHFNKYNSKYGALVLFILRLNPITSSDIFSYLAGAIEMPYKKFIISTTLGILPTIILVSYFGELFINQSSILKLFFFVIALIYVLIFVYGYYKIGKEKVKDKLKNFRK